MEKLTKEERLRKIRCQKKKVLRERALLKAPVEERQRSVEEELKKIRKCRLKGASFVSNNEVKHSHFLPGKLFDVWFCPHGFCRQLHHKKIATTVNPHFWNSPIGRQRLSDMMDEYAEEHRISKDEIPKAMLVVTRRPDKKSYFHFTLDGRTKFRKVKTKEAKKRSEQDKGDK